MNRIDNNPIFISVTIFTFVSYLFSTLAFIVPQWYAIWPGSLSSFQNIGLWEICFYSFMQEDVYDKIYSDCYHINYAGISDLKNWIVTNWFLASQILFTLNFVSLMLASVLCVAMSVGSLGLRRKKNAIIITVLHCIAWLTSLLTLILFGTGTRNLTEDQWMPNPDQCHLSWSFGSASLALLSSMVCLGQLASVLKSSRNGMIQWSCSKSVLYDSGDDVLRPDPERSSTLPSHSVYDPRGDLSSKLSGNKDPSILSNKHSVPYRNPSKPNSQIEMSLISDPSKKPFSVISKTSHSKEDISIETKQPAMYAKKPTKMANTHSEDSMSKSEQPKQMTKNPARTFSPPASQLTASNISGPSTVIAAKPMKKK